MPSDAPDPRHLPSVDRVLREIGDTELPRPALVAAVRRVLGELRTAAAAGSHPHADPITAVRDAVDRLLRRRIRPVINATGIIVHTNLGRSPLHPAAQRAVNQVTAGYSTLEFDLETGQRSGRAAYLEHNLAILCGAAAATVVNNCAAAVLLILRHFAGQSPRNQVIVSRGELVQIGGGFRVPEVLQESGAVLCEVGTTNQTTAADYRQAMGAQTAAILRVHRSNFYQEGFVASPTTAEVAAVAKAAAVPLIEDLGSGATFDTRMLGGGEQEPTAEKSLAAGADIVCFSGDKLLGGPQAGIIAGSAVNISAIKRQPLFRALRADKLALAALEATVDATLAGDAADVPIRAMMNQSLETLRARAEAIVKALAATDIAVKAVDAEAQVGGGSLPRTVLPSIALELTPPPTMSVERLAAALRTGETPVVGYIFDQRFRADLRTVFPEQDDALLKALLAVTASKP